MMPSRIGRYRVDECLGRGGMGEVWKAWDEGLDRWVAIKSLIPGMLSAERREGLKQEARAVAALSHPAIAQIYDIVSEDGADYLVLEFVEGTNLGKALHEGRLPTATALRLAADVAGGLAAAHERGIVHRDLKPENVVMTPDGRAKILDFGLARLIAAGAPAAAEGGFGGTLSAMSPEQVERRALDQRTDLFSLGSLMYEMLTGQHPFKAGFPIETMHRISHFQPPRVDEVDPALPAELGALVERLLAKAAEDRPTGAGEVARELQQILPQVEPSAPARAAPRRRRWWLAAAAAVVAAAAGLGMWWQSTRAAEPLYVAVLRPEAEAPEGGEMLASAVRLAEMNALAGLDGVYVLGANEVDGISGPPARVAAAVGAGDLLAARVRQTDSLARVELTRYAADGRVVWTDAFDAPADDFQLLVETTAAHLVRGYGSHRPRRGAFTDSASPEAYREFLELRQEVQHPPKDLSWPAILDRLTSLRERAPELLNIHLLEASVARYLYESTREPGYLERADAAVAAARKLAPEDPRPLITALEVDLAANRLDAAESKVAELARLAALQPGGAAAAGRSRRAARRPRGGDRAARALSEPAPLVADAAGARQGRGPQQPLRGRPGIPRGGARACARQRLRPRRAGEHRGQPRRRRTRRGALPRAGGGLAAAGLPGQPGPRRDAAGPLRPGRAAARGGGRLRRPTALGRCQPGRLLPAAR